MKSAEWICLRCIGTKALTLVGGYCGWGDKGRGCWKSIDWETMWLPIGEVSLIATSPTISLIGTAHSE